MTMWHTYSRPGAIAGWGGRGFLAPQSRKAQVAISQLYFSQRHRPHQLRLGLRSTRYGLQGALPTARIRSEPRRCEGKVWPHAPCNRHGGARSGRLQLAVCTLGSSLIPMIITASPVVSTRCARGGAEVKRPTWRLSRTSAGSRGHGRISAWIGLTDPLKVFCRRILRAFFRSFSPTTQGG